MRSFFIVVAFLALIFVTCQFGVVRAIRRYIFAKYEKLKVRDSVLIFFGLFVANILFAFLSMNSGWAHHDSQAQKILAVTFFTYLGVTLALGVLLAILKTIYMTMSLAVAGYRLLLILVSGDLGGFEGGRKSRAMIRSPESSESSGHSEAHTDHEKATPNLSNPGRSASFHGLGFSHSGARSRTWVKWARIIAAGTILLFVSAGINGVIGAYSSPDIETFHIKDKKLEGLDRPITLIQVTDIHYGMFYDKRDLEKLVETLNSLEGDAVVFTGDIFHSPQTNVESAPEVLRKLRERRFGNMVVMGNHEFYAGEKRSIKALEEGGLVILRDEWKTFIDGTGAIHLAGLDDPGKNWLFGDQFPNFPRLMEKAPTGNGFRILLSHRPAAFALAAQNEFDLTLSGHTHGGQVVVPWFNSSKGWSLANIASKYTLGWYSDGDSRMYLNRGVGLTFVPWRINCSPEISVFTFTAS